MGVSAQSQTFASSTFDWDLNGWRGDTCQGGFSWVQQGGAPDGHLRWAEPCSSTFALAPEEFLGDWSSLSGTGALSFDYRIAARPTDGNARPYEVVVWGADGSVLRWAQDTPNTVTDWTHFVIPIRSENWITVVGDFESAIVNVRSLRIRIRMFDNTLPQQDNRIDNVILSVPEPSSLLALGVCGGFLALGRRRQPKTAG